MHQYSKVSQVIGISEDVFEKSAINFAIVHIEFGVRRYYFGGVRYYGKRSIFGITQNELGSVHAISTTNFELCPNKIVAYFYSACTTPILYNIW